MALIARKALFETLNPFVQAKRFRGKINIRRPKPPHYERAMFIELTRPYFINPNKDKLPIELCADLKEKRKETVKYNPFQSIIAGELSRWFQNSKLVVFYHMNSMDSDEQYKAYVMFKREKMHYKNYGKETLAEAVKGTKYETILDFYVSRNMIVFSPEIQIKKVLKITKKFPQLVLMAAIVDGQLVNKDQLLELSNIPDLQCAQAQLVQTLNTAASTLHQQLNTHQNTLVSQLQERMKQLEEEK